MPSRRQTLYFLSLLLCALLPRLASAAEWPKGLVVAEKSISPDGHYGLVIPGRDTLEDDNAPRDNYLANLKTHRLLGKIHGADYVEGENHRGFNVVWAADSSWGVVTYDARYGFDSIHVLEPNETSFDQAEIGKLVQTSLNAAIAKQSHDKAGDCDGSVYYRLASDRKLRLRSLAMTNPKQFENVTTYYALFQGTYDLKTRHWKVTDTRPVTTQNEALEAALLDADFSTDTYPSETERAAALDDLLNKVYEAVRFVLPADRFAQVKQEQIAWLKKRDATTSAKEKRQMLEARIKALQDLLW